MDGHRWWDLHNPYRYRDENLERLGFTSYRAYCKSTLWGAIRARVLARYPTCQCCGKRPSTQVHHRSYDLATLEGRNLNSLTSTCGHCHLKAERPEQMRRFSYDRLMEANTRYLHSKRKRRRYTRPIDDMTPRLRKPGD